MVKLGIIQTTSYRSNEQGIERVSKLLNQAGNKETDMICLPEQWLRQNKINDFHKVFERFKKIAKEHCMTIIPGAFYERESHAFTISAPVIDPSGEIIGKQTKIHPFNYEKKLIKAGKSTVVFKTSCKFGIIICYDMVFAEVARSLSMKGAEVLFSPSRIVKNGIYPWHLYVTVRALENRIPILASNIENRKFGGKSAIIDLKKKNGIVAPKKIELHGQTAKLVEFDLARYKRIRNERFADLRKFS